MLLGTRLLPVIKAEHRLSSFVVASNCLPSTVKTAYGRWRSRLGLALYRSRYCPVPTSPNCVLSAVLRPGDVYIDVGASEGQMVCLGSVATGARGRVYAFEPRQQAVRHLRRLCAAYGMSNVELFENLVGDREGDCQLFESADAPESSSVSPDWVGGVASSYPMVTLDAWAKRNSVLRADLMKIDVEGAEIKVLQGAAGFLRTVQPIVILEIRDREVRRRSFGYDVPDLMELLRAAGYEEFYCLRRPGLARISTGADIGDEDHDMVALCPRKSSHQNAKNRMKIALVR